MSALSFVSKRGSYLETYWSDALHRQVRTEASVGDARQKRHVLAPVSRRLRAPRSPLRDHAQIGRSETFSPSRPRTLAIRYPV